MRTEREEVEDIEVGFGVALVKEPGEDVIDAWNTDDCA
jgi:hypothetical protein